MSDTTVLSNTLPGRPGLNSAAPADGYPAYEGEKLKLTIETTDLAGAGYTDIQFYLAVDDELNPQLLNPDGVSGTACHPDSEGVLHQPVTAGQAYSIDAVVIGRSGDLATWNVDVTGPSLPTLKFQPNVNYQTNAAETDLLWGYQFLPSGYIDTPNAQNALHVTNYQVKDKGTQVGVTRTFSARIRNSDPKGTLSNFNFFNNHTSPPTLLSLTPNKKGVWVDSDANGMLDFYITSNTATTNAVLANLIISVGPSEVPLPTIIVANLIDVPQDAQLDAPLIEGGSADYWVDPTQPLSIIVPTPPVGSLQPGDLLFLFVNGVLLPETGRPYSAGLINAKLPFFCIAASYLNSSFDGSVNTMTYLVIREANRSVKSSTYKFKAQGLGGGDKLNPPFNPGPQSYANPPTINGWETGDVLGFDNVKNGLTVRIAWDSKWPSQVSAGDSFKIYCFYNGYRRNDQGAWSGPIVPKDTAPVSAQDLLNGYIDTPLDYQPLSWWVPGSENQKSALQIQYYVATTQSYSTPSDQYFLMTTPAGGV